MHDRTITGMLEDLDARRYSSVELTRHHLERIARLDKRLNSYITVCEETALADAERADRLRAEGKTLPLLGIPVAHKDIFCTDGIRTTAASRMLDNFISPYDASVVRHLKDAGAVMLGKTNMDEFAMGSSTENSFYGDTRNPWDETRVPGGSSGGSAAAVAARLCAAATGTDTGGSIRQPAAMCGITGIKPTYGRVSRWGMIAFASSLDQAGPMTRTAQDAALMLEVMSGFDDRDSTSIEVDVPDYTASLNNSIKGLKVGLCKEYFADGLDDASASLIMDAVNTLAGLGAEIVDVSLPATRYSVPAYYVIAPAEASANLSRYDGVRFGYRCEAPVDIEDLYTRSRSEGFGKEVRHRIMLGTFALSAGYYDAYYRKAQQVRRLIKDDFARAFETVDVIAGPVCPTPAFRLGEKTDDPVAMYLQDIYTIAS
ncbi:MAG TPA: Asp-tRNA(Asn)/Glu-tRNA(Gln) amidotransferase subunit GatA, partial [Pseudomonadales bacterium]|nr:Asp-tRNA(Asn)/Glu-tRNA(Gln) amidotransferase subunit GatA [Pseudomonadales bacterium]